MLETNDVINRSAHNAIVGRVSFVSNFEPDELARRDVWVQWGGGIKRIVTTVAIVEGDESLTHAKWCQTANIQEFLSPTPHSQIDHLLGLVCAGVAGACPVYDERPEEIRVPIARAVFGAIAVLEAAEFTHFRYLSILTS